MAKRSAVYSVWKPPTSSCSASTRSNGGRFSSAVPAIMNTTNGTRPVIQRFQRKPGLAVHDQVGRQRSGDQQHRGDRQAQRGLVGDHLRRGADRAEQRVLRSRGPAGEHHAVDRDRRHGENQQDADLRVGHLHEGLLAEQGDHSVVVAGEVAGDGHHREHHEGGYQRQVGRQAVHERIGADRRQVLLEEQLDAVGQGLQDPERAGPVGADAVLHVGDELALEPDHQHDADRAGRRTPRPPSTPRSGSPSSRSSPESSGSIRRTSTLTSHTWSAKCTRAPGSPPSRLWWITATPRGTDASARAMSVSEPCGDVTRTRAPADTPSGAASLGQSSTSARPASCAEDGDTDSRVPRS